IGARAVPADPGGLDRTVDLEGITGVHRAVEQPVAPVRPDEVRLFPRTRALVVRRDEWAWQREIARAERAGATYGSHAVIGTEITLPGREEQADHLARRQCHLRRLDQRQLPTLIGLEEQGRIALEREAV